MLILSILVSVLTGFLLVRVLWPGSAKLDRSDWLRLPLGVWCGFGLSSVTSFGAQVANPGSRATWIITDVVLLALTAALWALFGRRTPDVAVVDEEAAWPTAKWVVLAMVPTMVIAYLLMALPRQTGDIDAWSIWNMKARFLYRGGSFTTMAEPLLAWIHPEFPYLLPALALRSWHWAGEETMTGPMAIAGVFAVSLAMGMYGVVRLLRTPTQGLLAFAALLGSAGFIGNAAVQYADFPLATLLFGSVAATAASQRLGLPRLALIAGLCAGFVAWTKFEGAFYAVALAGIAVWRLGIGSLVPFAIGVIPGAAMLTYFQLVIAPSTKSISADPVALLIAIASKVFTFSFLGWVVSPLVVLGLYLYCCGVAPVRRHGWFALLALFVAGCLAIIVRDDNAGDAAAIRIVLHLWPATLLAAFFHANAPEELVVITGKAAAKLSRK